MSQVTTILERQRAVLDLPLNRHLGILYDGLVDGIAQAHITARLIWRPSGAICMAARCRPVARSQAFSRYCLSLMIISTR
jgi:hypothetical protein